MRQLDVCSLKIGEPEWKAQVKQIRMPKARGLPAVVMALALCAVFLLAGYQFIRNVGAQMDEVQFTGAIFPPLEDTAAIHIGGIRIPLMIDTYAGSLKAWLYLPVFKLLRPNVYSLRVPVLLLGAATLFVFFLFFRMAMGDAAAIGCTALLAVDPLFTIMTVLDSGIVVLQHLLAAGALLLFVQFHRTGRRWMLGGAAFLCGLALWDKATFLWVMCAFAGGAAAAFPRQLRASLKPSLVGLFGACLMAGAAPLIYYNLTSPGEMPQTAGGLAVPGLPHRLVMLGRTLDGSSLFELLINEQPPRAAVSINRKTERAAVAVSRWAGGPTRHWLLPAFVLSLLVLPFAWRTRVRRWMLFSAVGFAAGFAVTLPFAKAGASQHIILLWPLPQMLVVSAVLAVGDRIRRPAAVLAAATGVLVISGLLVTTTYYAEIVQKGTARYWSDAINPLRSELQRLSGASLICLDWGIMYPLRFLAGGKLPLSYEGAGLDDPPDSAERQAKVVYFLERSTNLYISFADRTGLPDQRLARLQAVASRSGFREETITTVADRFRRPVYRVSVFRKD